MGNIKSHCRRLVLDLEPDEAYYWIYAQELDWGYFDHPPVIALLIFIGKSLAGGELGVRLLMPFLSIGTFLIVWELAGKPKKWPEFSLLLVLFTAMPLLQVYAFVATPDVPLLFFSALFFLVYRQFLDRTDLVRSLILGGVMAALLYSKYHGVLLIFFTLLSNWKLLRNPYFYLASIFGALLFVPHLYWQYVHDFPSFRYHLSGRDDPYELKHTTNYLLNQLLIFSPLLFPFIIRVLWKEKARDTLEKAFRFVIFGFWGFFLYTTSKGHVEPQWTVILSLAFILILYRTGTQNEVQYKWLKRMALISTGLLILARIIMAIPGTGLKTPFNRNGWIAELKSVAGETPVVFQNSYRNPAMYYFYTGQRAYTFTDNCYRKNQFDILDWEKGLQGQSVWMAGQTTWESPGARTLSMPGNTFNIKKLDNLQLSQKIILETNLPEGPWKPGEMLDLNIRLTNPYQHDIFPNRGSLPLSIKERYGPQDCLEDYSNLELIDAPDVWPANSSITLSARLKVREVYPAGDYPFYLCIQTGDLPLALSSKGYKVTIE